MLSSSVSSTNSRPRPPGRVPRRKSSLTFVESVLHTPGDSEPLPAIVDIPPPYRLSEAMDALPDDDVFMEHSRVGSNEGELDDHWMKDKSKEELSQLLLTAESIIQRRQHELTLAALVGKELLQKNVELKSKYDGVLKRLPLTPSTSHENPRAQRTASWLTDVSASDEEPDNSLDDINTSFSPQENMTPTPAQRHFKGTPHHITASSSAVSFLNSQNDMLLDRLAAIEKETAQAELEGKQRLKALEREIAALNMELEASRQRAVELEDEMKAKAEREKRKAAAAARLKALRESMSSRPHNEVESPKMDFAPPNELTALRPTLLPRPVEETDDDNDQLLTSEEDASHQDERSAAAADARSTQERKVVHQLLLKVAELEKANKELLTRHLDTQTRLDRASKDADALNSVFDTIEKDEMFEEELIREASSSSSISSTQHSLRGSSHSGSPKPWKRHKTRPRSVLSVHPQKTPTVRKSGSQSALVPITFSPPSPSPTISASTSLIDSPSFNRIALKTRHFRTSLHEELDSALRASISLDSALGMSSQDDSDEILSFPRSESQIDAAVFALREDTTRYRRPLDLVLTTFPSSREIIRSISPGPLVPGSYNSPQKSSTALPDSDDTPTRLSLLRKSTSLGDISSHIKHGSIRSRRKVSERIEGLDLAAVVEDDNDVVNGDAQATKQVELQSWTALLLEVWIILQFCIVLAVFVFTAAKKGPRGVIKAARKQ